MRARPSAEPAPAPAEGRRRRRHPAVLALLPIVGLIFAASLLWFSRNYRIFVDDGLYLLQAENLLSGRGVTIFGDDEEVVRGPVFPALLGFLTLFLDRDVPAIAMAARGLAIVNPFLVYLLVRRLADPWAGLLAAVLVAAFGYTAVLTQSLNIDAPMLTFLLLAALGVIRSVDRGSERASLLSGVALGAAILTKETALAVLPMGIAAAGFLAWRGRGPLLHYAGVAAVCLPWWLYVLASTGEIYLVGRLSGALAAAAIAALVLVGAAAALVWRRGGLGAVLRTERSRYLAAWGVVVGWVLLLSPMLLSTSPKLDELSVASARGYLELRVLPNTPVWYLFGAAALYIAYRIARGHRLWALYGALLVMHVPVALLLLAERYTLARQWLVVQTLLYGALAALGVALVRAALVRRPWGVQRALPAVAALALAAVLVPTGAARGRFLLRDDAPSYDRVSDNQLNVAVRDMRDWMRAELPAGGGLVSTWHYSYQLAFQTGVEQNWSLLDLDCPEVPRSLVATACGYSAEIAERPPTESVWFRLDQSCGGAALSLPTVLRQMNEKGARYLLMTQDRRHPGLFAAGPELERSGAFRILHSSYLTGERGVAEAQGLVLLERTGRAAGPVPAQMTAATAGRALGCARAAHGDGFAEEIRRDFPAGVEVTGESPIAAYFRVQMDSIYRSGGTTS